MEQSPGAGGIVRPAKSSVVEVGKRQEIPSSGKSRINSQSLFEIGARFGYALLGQTTSAIDVPADSIEVIGLQTGWRFASSQFRVSTNERTTGASQCTSYVLDKIVAQTEHVDQ